MPCGPPRGRARRPLCAPAGNPRRRGHSSPATCSSDRQPRGTDMLSRRCLIAVAAILLGGPALAEERSIVVASTTSTQDSGLFGHILPLFKARTGIDVKVVAQGTGQALDTGRLGDADVVFVHAKSAAEQFLV